MRRIVNTASRKRVMSFLSRCTNAQFTWLERIGPDYIWVLRHMYGPLGATVEQLSMVSGWTQHVINPKRDQALYLLGMRRKGCNAASIRAAENRRAEFEARQRLYYLREHTKLSPADVEVIDLALRFGSTPSDIAKHCDWTVQTLFHALGRLCGNAQLMTERPGSRVRKAALANLLENKLNPKATLEADILERLEEDFAVVDLAAEWEAEPTILSAIVAEVRRELALAPSTRKAFALINSKKSGRGVARGSLAIRSLNAKLLPLYRQFRERNQPFSKSEHTYLRLRVKGATIASAGTEAFGSSPWRSMALERAFLETVVPVKREFPEVLPLPPFTEEQRALMERLRYVRL